MSAENAFRSAMETAAAVAWRDADKLRKVPIQPAFESAFRAAVEAEAEELRAMLAKTKDILWRVEGGEIVWRYEARDLLFALSRLEAKGESHG